MRKQSKLMSMTGPVQSHYHESSLEIMKAVQAVPAVTDTIVTRAV